MSKGVIIGLIILVALILAGALFWMSLGGTSREAAPAADAVGSNAPGAASDAKPTSARPDEPAAAPENSFIVCPGNPRCP